MPDEHPDTDSARIRRHCREVLERLDAECEAAAQQEATPAEKTLHQDMQAIHRTARYQLQQALTNEEGLASLERYRSHHVLCHFDLIADIAYDIAKGHGETPRLLANPVTLRLLTRHIRPGMPIDEMQKAARSMIASGASLPTGLGRTRNYLVAAKVTLGHIDQGQPVVWDHSSTLVLPRRLSEIAKVSATGAMLDDQIQMPVLNGLGLSIKQITIATANSTAMTIATDADDLLVEV